MFYFLAFINTAAHSGNDVHKLPNNRVHWANMGPIWGRQDPGGPHVGPMNFAMLAPIVFPLPWEAVFEDWCLGPIVGAS